MAKAGLEINKIVENINATAESSDFFIWRVPVAKFVQITVIISSIGSSKF